MKWKDFKAAIDGRFLETTDMEDILYHAFMNSMIDFHKASVAYVKALEQKAWDSRNKFEEAAVCIAQHLSGNFTAPNDTRDLKKRMVHAYNLSETMVNHVFDSEAGYTEEDEKEFDKLMMMVYGTDFKGHHYMWEIDKESATSNNGHEPNLSITVKKRLI